MTPLHPCPHCRAACSLLDVADTPSPVFLRVQAVCTKRCGYRGPLSTTYCAEHGSDVHEQAVHEATERHNAIANKGERNG